MNLDIYFYIYLIIIILLLLITALILKKSTSRVNILFVTTPILFSLILVFNVLSYFMIVPPFLLWFPYLIAPTGIVFAAWYIVYGSELTVNKSFLFIQTIYIGFSLFSSLYLQIAYPTENVHIIGLNHLVLTLPLCMAAIQYYKIIPLIPDQKEKIFALDFGLFLVMIGTILRGLNYYLVGQDLVLGLVIIIIGTFLVLLSFTNILQPTQTQLVKNLVPNL